MTLNHLQILALNKILTYIEYYKFDWHLQLTLIQLSISLSIFLLHVQEILSICV